MRRCEGKSELSRLFSSGQENDEMSDIYTDFLDVQRWLASGRARPPTMRNRELLDCNAAELQPTQMTSFIERSLPIVRENRRRILSNFDAELLMPISGNCLVYLPQFTLSDGIAESLSSGFFDVHNCPGWDTWIGRLRLCEGADALISWIPDELLGLVNSGLNSNAERCLLWADDLPEDATMIKVLLGDRNGSGFDSEAIS